MLIFACFMFRCRYKIPPDLFAFKLADKQVSKDKETHKETVTNELQSEEVNPDSNEFVIKVEPSESESIVDNDDSLPNALICVQNTAMQPAIVK